MLGHPCLAQHTSRGFGEANLRSWRRGEVKNRTSPERATVSRGVDEAPITMELYLIDVSPDQLNRWAETGAEITITGKTGEGAFALPAHYFQGFRAVLQRTAAPLR